MPTAKNRLAFEAIGTKWEIIFASELTTTQTRALTRQTHERIELFDQTFSRFRTDSWVTKLATRAGVYNLPTDAYELLRFYEQLYQVTGGLVTPFIGQTMVDAGYDASYSFISRPLHPPPAWEEATSFDREHLTLHQPALLDFGAAGKGYLVDIIGQLIESMGPQSFTINAGGDIYHRSTTKTAVTIGLENPRDASEAIGTIELGDESLCASSGSRRAWGEYHHIINPRTLQSPRNILATWVIARDTMTADGLATALFFTSASVLAKQFSFSYACLNDQMQLTYSKTLPITVYKEEHHELSR